MDYDQKLPSEKSFGITFSIIFIIISFFLRSNNILFIVSFSLSILIFILTFLYPKSLTYPNLLWYKFGIKIAKFTSPIFLSIIYFMVICPYALFYKIKKEKQYIINRNINNSVWSIRKNKPEKMDEMF